jgi:hypothetical protein
MNLCWSSVLVGLLLLAVSTRGQGPALKFKMPLAPQLSEPNSQMGIEPPVHTRPIDQTMTKDDKNHQHHSAAHKEPVGNPLTMEPDDPRLGEQPKPIPPGAQLQFNMGIKYEPQTHHQQLGRNSAPQAINIREADGRRFFLVTGPESAGNRHVVSMLTASGCAGAADHFQPFDLQRDRHPDWHSSIRWDWQTRRQFNNSECFVMHRSLPHAFHWPKIGLLLDQLHAFGFKPHVINTERAPLIMAHSQVRRKHAPSVSAALHNIDMGRRLLLTAMATQPETMPYDVVHHNDLELKANVVHLLKRCGRKVTLNQPRFRNTDSDYVDEQKEPIDLSVYEDADPAAIDPNK